MPTHQHEHDRLTADRVIEILGLEPLPGEGGFFRETYKAPGVIPAAALPGHTGSRSHSTQIYYLLRAGAVSTLHRVASDEVFHHYLGAPVTQLVITPDGTPSTSVIGPDLAGGHRPQAVVPAHHWQGALLSQDLGDARSSETGPEAWALLGCTVSPGFEWADFELIDAERHAEVVAIARGEGMGRLA